MTIRSFWLIVLKIIGIWLIVENSFSVVPHYLSTLFYYLGDNNSGVIDIMILLIALLFLVFVYYLVLKYFILKTEKLIDILKLDENFPEEKLELTFEKNKIIKVIVILLGGFIFIEGVPELANSLFNFMQEKHVFRRDPNAGWTIFYLFKVITGLILIFKGSKIVDKFINQHSLKNLKSQN